MNHEESYAFLTLNEMAQGNVIWIEPCEAGVRLTIWDDDKSAVFEAPSLVEAIMIAIAGELRM